MDKKAIEIVDVLKMKLAPGPDQDAAGALGWQILYNVKMYLLYGQGYRSITYVPNATFILF